MLQIFEQETNIIDLTRTNILLLILKQEEATLTMATPSMADEEAITNVGAPPQTLIQAFPGPRHGPGNIQQEDDDADVNSLNSDGAEDQALLKK